MKITSQSSSQEIQQAFKNSAPISFENKPEVKELVAKEFKEMIARLRAKSAFANFNK